MSWIGWDEIEDAVKISVGILGTLWLDPHLEKLMPKAASVIIAAIISTLITAIFSRKIFSPATVNVKWAGPQGEDLNVARIPLYNPPGTHQYLMTITAHSRSIMGYLMVRHVATATPIEVRLGMDSLMKASIEAAYNGLGTARCHQGAVLCKLVEQEPRRQWGNSLVVRYFDAPQNPVPQVRKVGIRFQQRRCLNKFIRFTCDIREVEIKGA